MWVGIIAIASKPLHIHRNILGGIFSYMVGKESVKDEENGVEVV